MAISPRRHSLRPKRTSQVSHLGTRTRSPFLRVGNMLCPTTPTVVKTKVVTKKATSRASPTCRNHSLKR
jgi:hypothetical protein